MTSFSAAELDYLLGERRLGRLATADATGQPHVVPVGWRYNPELGTIDISGRNFAATKKFRNVRENPKAAFVVDDILPPGDRALLWSRAGPRPSRLRLIPAPAGR